MLVRHGEERHRLGRSAVRRQTPKVVPDLQRLHSQRMMGMALDAGGQLHRRVPANISGKLFDQASYGVDPTTGLLDYDAAQVREFRPLVLVAGYSAYPRNPNFAVLAEIAHEVGATFML